MTVEDLKQKIKDPNFSNKNLDDLFRNLSDDNNFMDSLTKENSKEITNLLSRHRPKMFAQIPF